MKNRCKKVEELFGAYIYHVVTPDERECVEKHISKCRKCADELSSRQKTLERFKPREEFGEMPQHIQDNFSLNVYKRIALDSLKNQSRQAYLQRFVLQPSFALLIIAFGIAVFFLRYHPGQFVNVAKESPSVVAKTEEINKKDLRASIYMDEFFQREGATYKSKPQPVKQPEVVEATKAKSETPVEQKLSPETPNLLADVALTPDPKALLEDANFIHFSLGDRKRALAQYQKLLDNYPNTDAAAVAGQMIKSIRESEYRAQNENPSIQTVDMEI